MQNLIRLEQIQWDRLLEGGLVLVLGIAFVRMILMPGIAILFRGASQQVRLGVRKLVWYAGLFFVLVGALSRMGVQVTGILGAAGIAGVAVGVASQSSLSNIIAGLFLVSENAFTIGDVIQVETTTGVVYAVDLLAVRLRTFDNTLIRIPHQKLITSVVTNITKFPVRRMDFKLRVPYGTDLRLVQDLLRQVVSRHPLALNNPEAFVMFTEFSSSGVEVLLGVWFEKSDFMAVKNGITLDLLETFASRGIELPYPHIEIVSGNNKENHGSNVS